MRTIIALVFLLITGQGIPEGIWIHKEHNSKIEIYEEDGVIHGRLLSSHHPKAKKGSKILEGVIFSNGEWTGKMYDIEKERWVNVRIDPKGQFLLFEVQYGFLDKKVRWFRESLF